MRRFPRFRHKICQSKTNKIINPQEVWQVFQPDPRNCKEIKEWNFVRIKRGIYEGDLGLVNRIDSETTNVIVYVVPRIKPRAQSKQRITKNRFNLDIGDDLNSNMNLDINDVKSEPVRSKNREFQVQYDNKGRVIPKLFDPEDYPDRDVLYFSGKEYGEAFDNDNSTINRELRMQNYTFLNGLLMMKFSIHALEVEDVLPTYKEIEIFMKNQKNPEIKQIMEESIRKLNNPSKRLKKNLQRGDIIAITKGEYNGLKGVVMDFDKESIKIDFSVYNKNLKDPIFFKADELKKYFDVGEKVEILEGDKKERSGKIIHIEDDKVHIFLDDLNENVIMYASDVRRNNSVGVNGARIFKRQAGLDKFDLVAFSNNSVGMIISSEVGFCLVLDTNGCTKKVPNVEIQNKITNENVGKNNFNQEIRPRYTIKIIYGENKGRMALVKQVYNNHVFLFDKNQVINSGIFLESISNCYLLNTYKYDNVQNQGKFNNERVEG